MNNNGKHVAAADGGPALHAGIGSRIIDGITKQLEGQMQMVRHDGLQVKVSMPLPELS